MSSNDGISSNKEEDDTLNNDLTSVSPEETLIHGAGDGNSGGIIKTLSEATKEETVGTKPGDSIMKSITETSKGSGDCTASKEDSTTEKVLITEDKAEQEKKTVSDIEMEEDDLESWVDDEDNILTSDNESGKKDSENNEDLNHEARIEVKSPETKADSGINEENCLENSSKDSNEAMDVDNTSDEAKEISESDDNNAKTQVKSLATEADTDLPKDDKPDSQEAVEQRDIKNVGKTSLMPVKTTVDDNNLSIDNNKLVNYNDSINISMDSPIQINTDHHLNRPDVMLEIPTHELIDIDEVLDSPDVTNVDDDKIDDSEIGDDNAVVDSTEDQGDQVVQDMAVEGDQINDKSQDMAVEESINDKNVIQVGNDTSEKRPCDVSAEVVTSKASTIEDVQPSTSTGFMKMTPDTSGEVPEMSDSLGLLAESCRVRDDDEEQDYDEDADDDDDYDPDESSNQVSAEHSDDSNTPTRDEEERELEEREIEETEEVDYKCAEMFEFTMNNIDGTQTEVEETVVMKTEVKTEISGYSSEITTPILPEITTGVQELKVKEEKGVTIEEKNKKDLTPAVKETPEDGVIPMDQIKKEPTDAVKPKARIIGPRVEAVKDAGDTPVSARSSTISNDDVIEQPIFIETFKVSDDEDDLEPSPKEPVESEEKKIKTKEDEEIVEESMTEEQKIESQELPTPEPSKSPKTSPVKLKKLSITSIQNESVVSYVDLEESSSEDDEKVPKKHSCLRSLLQTPIPIETGNLQSQPEDVTTVNLPPEIEVMSTSGGSGNTSEIVVKEGEVVISGVPKPPPLRPARLNTSEVTIKTTSGTETTLIIPSTKMNESTKFDQNKTSSTQTAKPKLGLEIFSLDSDDDETAEAPKETPEVSPEKKYKKKKCINEACKSGVKIFKLADNLTASYYDAKNKKRPLICLSCVEESAARNQRLIASIKSMTPILELELTNSSLDLVEILDSDSEEEDTQPPQEPEEAIGEETAKFVEENLAAILNETWKKYNLDDRLKENKKGFDAEIEKLEKESKELDQMFEECQRATDKLRYDFYATFEHQIQELPSLHIYDTPEFNYMGPELGLSASEGTRQNAKRKVSSPMEIAAKRPAIPLGYAPLNEPSSKQEDTKNIDNNDDIDISVVKLSAEAAPHDLPPLGEQTRSPLYVGMTVFAMRNSFGPWVKAKILEVIPKGPGPGTFTMCRIQYDNKMKNNIKLLPARCLAYTEPPNARLTIGTRVIALFKDINKRESYYNGVIAEMPTPVNSYRYMVFFDDGYSQYVPHPFTRLVCECSPQVWEEVHPMSREFVRKYIAAYPERPMVRVHQGQEIEAEWNDKWWRSRILKVDASIALVEFIGADRKEWIYRGSNRLGPLFAELKAAERHRPRPMPRSKRLRSNMPYVEYTRSEEPTLIKPTPVPTPLTQQQQYEEIRRQRAVAKKSTAIGSLPASAQNLPPAGPGPTPRSLDSDTSRVVYYTPKNAIKPYKYVPHKCTPKCKRNDVLSLKELRTYNPLAKPLLSGWERQICRFKGQKEVMYRAPCGRRLRNMKELHRYLRMTESELPVDLFDFYHATHCLAEFVLNKCLVGKKDLSHGKENVPVPCVNYYDDSLPEFCSYNTERTPTSGVPLNLDPEFLCGCDCTDDCQDKTKCACWKMTLEGARTIGLEGPNIGYEFKRLPEPLPSGIYECNSRCKCKETCLNRVAQHPLQLKLQVFKTLKRGWGIRALNDVPKGAFLCVYAGNLLTDATANLDGLNEGDEYLAELDYIEVVEQMKEGYEEDIPEADKKLDKESIKKEEPVEESSSSSEEDDKGSKTDKEDDDFRPGHIGLGVMEFNKRLRRRDRKKKEEQQNKEEAEKDRDSKDSNIDDDCITISDDEEIREPSRFAAQPGMGGNDFISKYKSVRTLFGEDEACYIMDAKVQGNIGRYLNHSCSPNVFVQNVFVDTHDPRFPWVAFFALSHINAGTELTWNYNYDVGSVPGKVLYCYCEAPNCRGRLL